MNKQRAGTEGCWLGDHLEVVLDAWRPLELLHHAAQRKIIVEAAGELARRQIAAAILGIMASRRPHLRDRAIRTFEYIFCPSADSHRHMLTQSPGDPCIEHLGDGGIELWRHELEHRPEPPGVGCPPEGEPVFENPVVHVEVVVDNDHLVGDRGPAV